MPKMTIQVNWGSTILQTIPPRLTVDSANFVNSTKNAVQICFDAQGIDAGSIVVNESAETINAGGKDYTYEVIAYDS